MAWNVTGNIRGPEGPQGPAGVTGPQGPQGTQGPAGVAGPQGDQGEVGPAGPQGIPGEDGAGVEIAGSVATYAELPTTLGPSDSGDGYLVTADGKLYVWDGDTFPANGSGVEFRGPVGPAGPQGPQGVQGATGSTGATGEQGPAGAAGATGATGATGARGSKWFTGAGVPSGVSGAVAGDMYMDTGTGDVYQLS
ncbi:hypothetical protein ACTD5D_31855 [Nocardia takedensis]|uniref:hypothetical protein n=1 Tax=Nocardia takedensis TaxID=259390 RepID=UPI003F758AAA